MMPIQEACRLPRANGRSRWQQPISMKTEFKMYWSVTTREMGDNSTCFVALTMRTR